MFQMFRLLFLLATSRAFLLVVPPDAAVGARLVDSGLPELGARRLYRLAAERSAPFVPGLLRVDALDGRVYLKQPVDCSGEKGSGLVQYIEPHAALMCNLQRIRLKYPISHVVFALKFLIASQRGS